MRRIVLFLALVLASVGGAGALGQEAGDAGRIAIAGADGNIHLYDVATGVVTPLTEDGAPDAKVYIWPTWSNDGRLAYFGVSVQPGDPYRFGIFLQPPEGDPIRAHTARDESFTYAHWAPGDCPAGDCRDLAVLYTNTNGELALRRVRAGEGAADVSVVEVETGGPFYWDWSPDGQSMFWARFGALLERYDVAANAVVETFAEAQGLERAVDWSPVDDRLLSSVRRADGAFDLVVFDGAAREVLVEGLEGGVAFEWSPDGTQVAYVDFADTAHLKIVDANTGSEVAALAQGVVAFFWSPDGARIAYLTFEPERLTPQPIAYRQPAQQAPQLQWFIYDLATDATAVSVVFTPTSDMVYYLSFFDQFARGHRLWSPDSARIVYAERLGDGRDVVSLIDAGDPGAAPQILVEGRFGVFSW
ncbi:MAG: hypothetical protein M5R40_25100 [Anaerolineae bacterium]|nr:hypothetical protein [Anaerolineae bacterium]